MGLGLITIAETGVAKLGSVAAATRRWAPQAGCAEPLCKALFRLRKKGYSFCQNGGSGTTSLLRWSRNVIDAKRNWLRRASSKASFASAIDDLMKNSLPSWTLPRSVHGEG